MKRLRRRMFNIAAGVSLLLCMATVAGWLRSHYFIDRVDHLSFDRQSRREIEYGAISQTGTIKIYYATTTYDTFDGFETSLRRTQQSARSQAGWSRQATPPDPSHIQWDQSSFRHWLGFRAGSVRTGSDDESIIEIPYWFAVLCLLSPSVVSLGLRRRVRLLHLNWSHIAVRGRDALIAHTAAAYAIAMGWLAVSAFSHWSEFITALFSFSGLKFLLAFPLTLPVLMSDQLMFEDERMAFAIEASTYIAVFSLAFWWLWRRDAARHQAKPGLCRVCGYDLRATPERCPECGTIPIATKGAAT